MRILFSQIFTDPNEAYVRAKLERSFRRHAELGRQLDSDAFDNQVANVINQLGTSVPIAHPDTFYEITAEQEAEIEARKRCVMATLLREWPLIEGEIIQEDLFTFLQEPFGSLQANSAVLRRTTNMSEIFYLFGDVQVVEGDLVFIEPEAVPHTTVAAVPRTLKGSINAAKLGKTLGLGVVSGFGGQIGALIFDAIFPPGVPDYFDEIYKEIRSIVNQELKAANVELINGRINGVVSWVNNTYKPRKESGAPRKELSDMLTPQVDKLYTEATSTLMLPDYAKPGFSVFIIAAGVHLGLFQEQALVDPLQADPSKSSYAKTVALNARIYSDHIVKTFNEIVVQRQNAVEIRYDPLVTQDPSSPYMNTKDRYRWFDTITKTWGNIHEQYVDKDKNNHSGREEAEADRQNYLRGVISQLTSRLENPMDTAAQWSKLPAKPIPAAR